MLKLPLYSKKEVQLAIEFGLVISEVARENNWTLTKEKTTKAQEVFINEIRTRGFKKTALNFVPLILAVLEV
jgi:hypothetical protein